MMFRVFSRNIYKRQNENAKFLKIKNKVIEKIKLRKKKWAYRKTHIYRKCPNCKAEIRKKVNMFVHVLVVKKILML